MGYHCSCLGDYQLEIKFAYFGTFKYMQQGRSWAIAKPCALNGKTDMVYIYQTKNTQTLYGVIPSLA